jgi:hypothetical protein
MEVHLYSPTRLRDLDSDENYSFFWIMMRAEGVSKREFINYRQARNVSFTLEDGTDR